MGNDVKEEPNPPNPPPQGGDGGNHRRRGGRGRGRHRWNNNAGGGGAHDNTSNAKYTTRDKDLPHHVVFDNTGPNDASQFKRALEGMANYLYTTYSAEVSDAILNMQAVTITVEDTPLLKKDADGNDIPPTTWEEYKWKSTYTEQLKKSNLYDNSMPKAYIHIYNQCSTNLKNDLEASTAFPAVKMAKDPIGLLKLIQGLCCSFDSKTQSVTATVRSLKKLFTFYQRDGMDNATYHKEFMAHVETIETYGGMGAIAITPTLVKQKLIDMVSDSTCTDPNIPSAAELATAHKLVRDEFLAALMLDGAHRERYGALRNELTNQYGFGNDLYPKTVDQCLTMMNRRLDASTNRPQRGQQHQKPEQSIKQEEEALVFAQGTSDKHPSKGQQQREDAPSTKTSSSSGSVSRRSTAKPTKVICRLCGKEGHVSAVCPQRKPPPDQIHAMTAGQDDASESSDDESILILAQVDEELILTQGDTPARAPIDSNLVLLDSQSTVNLFSRPEHVTNIRPANKPIRVHCNKGTLETTLQADFGDTPVYFDSRGIANVLSLYLLGQKFKVTYDSEDRGGVFKVFTKAGVVEFKPTKKGLHALDITDNPEAAYLLVNDADIAYDSPVRTVRNNYEGFTKKQIQQATQARRLMGMIGSPTEREYQALVRLNLLKDCPISNADIINANRIFGPDLANIRGKKVRRKPEHVNTEIVEIPKHILEIQKSVTLVADVMFVNKVPFLISSSRNINLTTIEHVPHPTASKLAHLLHRIIRVYARAGFRVQTILMDNEFEKVKNHLDIAILNTTAAAEHVGEIERRIRVVKERSRGIICTLPYPTLPRTMIIHLIHHIVMWLNNFPVKNGISDRFSPREIVLRHKLDYRHHCRAPFGAYCEVYEDNTPTNSTKTRGIPAICLGPTGNIQGTYSFLSLVSGLVIKRRQFDELPAPDSIIKRVTALAGPDGVSSRLVFANRRKQPYDWPDNNATPTADDLDNTPMAIYPDMPAEMPGVLLSRHTHNNDNATRPLDHSHDIDWVEQADAAAQNADLDNMDHLPPPPEVFDNDNDIMYVPPPAPTLPFIKQEYTVPDPTSHLPPSSPQLRPSQVSRIPPPTKSSRTSGRTINLPKHLNDYHLFTTVADERRQPPEHPYTTAAGTNVDLAIHNEELMANLCHYVMVHTATSIALANQGQPTKKQYGLKAGLKRFGSRGDAAVSKELSQFHTLQCFFPRDARTLSREERRNALSSLMFLTEKRTGEVKARACADGSVQRQHVAKEEAAAPTVTSEAIFIQATIYAHENRDTATCDIPGAFLQADNPDYVLMRLDGILAELMVKVDPKLYRKYITTNTKGKPVLYVQLEKAVYGMMKSALLFYRKLVADLTSLGFEINPYDPCVANKIVNGKQLTVCWHVDDLFIGHEDTAVVTHLLQWIANRYDTDDKKLNVIRGHKHDYLGMNLDFSTPGEISIDMIPYINKIIKAFPEKITGVQSTPASDHLFQVRPTSEAKFLPEDQARAYHHTTAQLLFLSRVRRDIQTTVAFLTTRVKRPDEDDWGKLKRVLKYLHSTRLLKLTLRADSLSNIIWYVDASHQLHDDCKGHTGSILTFGKGAVTSSSTKHKIPSKSSCESEIIGMYDKIGDILWTRQFLEAQGYTIQSNIIYQDNMSTLSLAKNGYVSSSKRTKHIKAKYFFVRHFYRTGEVDLKFCPTEQMWADVLTKPLQGAKFRQMRAFLMNCPIDYHEPELMDLPSPEPTLAPTRTAHPKRTIMGHLPRDDPTDHPTKPRCPRPEPSSRGCVETRSPGTHVPHPSRTTYKPTEKNVSWRESLFPRHISDSTTRSPKNSSYGRVESFCS